LKGKVSPKEMFKLDPYVGQFKSYDDNVLFIYLFIHFFFPNKISFFVFPFQKPNRDSQHTMQMELKSQNQRKRSLRKNKKNNKSYMKNILQV